MIVMKKIFLFFFIFFAAIHIANAQATLSSQDLTTINVDDLSDADIIYYYKKLQQSGITIDQAAQIAAAKGMPKEEIEKLKTRIQDLVASGKTNAAVSPAQKKLPVSDSVKSIRQQLDYIVPTKEEVIDKLIFGSELFSTSSLVFEPNLRIASPSNYQLGPDDHLLVNVYGLSEQAYDLTVSPEGSVYIQNTGPVQVAGLTVEEAATKIRAKLASTIYRAISTGQTKVQVTLGNIRSIRVTVIGQAKRPGNYTVSSLSTVFNVLYLCGGPSINGSYRNIELVRSNGVVKKIDLYNFLVKGSTEGNLSLIEGDVIRIPYYETRVTINGEVKRPGIFETKEGEHMQEVLNTAGGFTDSAYRSSVKITDFTDKDKRVADVKKEDYSNYKLSGHEIIQVDKINDRYSNRVTLEGAVMRPGQYELTDGLTLKQLIKNADGLREDAFLNRGVITRLKEDFTPEVVSFNIANILNGTDADIDLKREDEIIISSIFDLQSKKTISVQGQVRKPGVYEFKDSISIKDIIFQAGGFTESGTGKRIEVARRVVNADVTQSSTEIAEIVQIDAETDLQTKGTDFYLKPFDLVIVRTNPGYFTQKTINVQGEVLYPGPYVINSNDEKLSSIITRAGGFKNTADASAASLKRQNKLDVQSEIKTEKVEKITAGQLRDTTTSDSLAQEAVRPYDLIGINLEEIMKKPGNTTDLILEDGDIIYVPKKNQAVKVRGEVLFPTQFAFEEGHNMKYYIDKAGGYSSSAQKSKSFVLGANGNARKVKKFLFFRNYPDIVAGDEIYVPPIPDNSGKRLTTGELIAITTAAASLASVVIAILNSTK